MNNIAIVDYDAGNTKSVINALEFIGEKVKLTRNIEELKSADKIIFPGVGAFYESMKKLEEYKLVDTLISITGSGKPFLGICLGMQLLFDTSTEIIGADGDIDIVKGLGILPGKIIRFSQDHNYKIPHMGWNSVKQEKKSKLFDGIEDNSYFYFVHSFYLSAAERTDVAGTTDYVNLFDSAVEHKNIYGCQFHPEKSGDCGLKLLRNFCNI